PGRSGHGDHPEPPRRPRGLRAGPGQPGRRQRPRLGLREVEDMAEHLKLARLYLLILAIVTVGRWSLGFRHVPYAQGTDKRSIVMMTLFASVFYAPSTLRGLASAFFQQLRLPSCWGSLARWASFLSPLLP